MAIQFIRYVIWTGIFFSILIFFPDCGGPKPPTLEDFINLTGSRAVATQLLEGLTDGTHIADFDEDGKLIGVKPNPNPGQDSIACTNDADHPADFPREGENASPQSVSRGATIVRRAQKAFFVNFNGNKLEIFDTAKQAVVGSVAVGQRPRGVALTPDRQFAFVANSVAPSVSVVDIAGQRVAATITLPAGSAPYGIAITPDGASAYVANFAAAGSVFVIDVATRSLKTTIPAGNAPIHVAASPDGSRVFVTNFNGNSLMAIDTLTNTVAATATVPNPGDVALSFDGRWIYVTTNVLAPNGTLTILNGSTYAVSGTIPVGNLPVALALSPDGRFLFVANTGSTFVSQISTATNTLLQNVRSDQGIRTLTCVRR